MILHTVRGMCYWEFTSLFLFTRSTAGSSLSESGLSKHKQYKSKVLMALLFDYWVCRIRFLWKVDSWAGKIKWSKECKILGL